MGGPLTELQHAPLEVDDALVPLEHVKAEEEVHVVLLQHRERARVERPTHLHQHKGEATSEAVAGGIKHSIGVLHLARFRLTYHTAYLELCNVDPPQDLASTHALSNSREPGARTTCKDRLETGPLSAHTDPIACHLILLGTIYVCARIAPCMQVERCVRRVCLWLE